MAEYDELFEAEDEEMLQSILGTEGKWEESVTASDEERSYPRYRRGPTRLPLRREPFKPVAGVSGVNIRTPAGTAQAQFGKPVATTDAVNEAVRELKAELSSVAASVKKVNATVDANTAMLDKKVNSVNAELRKQAQQAQMMTLLPMLMTKTPVLQKVTMTPVEGTTAYDVKKAITFAVDEKGQDYKKDDSMLPLLLLTMGGGLGTQGGDGTSSMLMVLALSGALK